MPEDYTSSDLYCKACKKIFTNSSIYAHHLEGKKHKKNSKIQDKDDKKAENNNENENDLENAVSNKDEE